MPKSHWLKRAWRWLDAGPAIRIVAEDVAITVMSLIGLLVVSLFFKVLAATGYAQNRIEILETCHFYATLSASIVFMCGFVRDVVQFILLNTEERTSKR